MSEIIVAIDGYSGTGKSSTARQVAEQLGYIYIDSGAMYRAVTLFLLQEAVDLENLEKVTEALSSCDVAFDMEGITLNGVSVEDQIRTMEVSQMVSQVSAISEVRAKLVADQRKMSEEKAVVMDGRDIGTVVFPEAELKIFMTADVEVRVSRRKKQLMEKGIDEPDEVIRDNLVKRDAIDTTRADSPLKKAHDAIEIDTSYLTLRKQIDQIVEKANALRSG